MEEYVIYKIENLINSKCYIGKSKNVKRRWQDHLRIALTSDKRHPLYDSMRHHGIENFKFEVILNTTSIDIDSDEIRLIKEYNSIEDGYNLATGGTGGDTFSKLSEEAKSKKREKLSIASKYHGKRLSKLHSKNTKRLWEDVGYRQKVMDGIAKANLDPELKAHRSKKMTEVCNTPEMKKLRSENAMGINNSNYQGPYYVIGKDINEVFTYKKDIVKRFKINGTFKQLQDKLCQQGIILSRGY